MLDPWIIEEILRREEDRRREQEGSRIEAPLERPRYRETDPAMPKPAPTEDTGRGVVTIDI
jgi:hypothetical protein